MSEYIITQEEIECMFTRINNELNKGTRKLRIDFREIPEIVRCRDCKYHVENDTLFSFYNGTCDWWAESPKVDPDGFCSWGERKEVDA